MRILSNYQKINFNLYIPYLIQFHTNTLPQIKNVNQYPNPEKLYNIPNNTIIVIV
jgi:hypothetical protein